MRIAALLSLFATAAQPACTTDAMLVFDGSTSMAEADFNTGAPPRIEEARRAIARALPEIEPYRRVGLMVYGPLGYSGGAGKSGACSGVDLRFGPTENAAAPIIADINALRPAGLTPLTEATRRAAEALDYTARPAVVVLLTDGNETCGGRPCAASAALSALAHDLTIHVIGFRFSAHDAYFRWNNPEQTFGADNVASCLAEATGGLFVTTETVDELTTALQATLGCALVGDLRGAQPPDADTIAR
ncbi:MAG: VWA domain-containing protein [Pseudomonadota bacterium]